MAENKMVIWVNDDDKRTYYFKQDEIENFVDLGGNYFISSKMFNEKTVDELNAMLTSDFKSISRLDSDDVSEFFGIASSEVSVLGEEISIPDGKLIAYWVDEKHFEDLSDWDYSKKTSYWDGHNWKNIYFTEGYTTETLVTIDDDGRRIDSDLRNGCNYVFMGLGSHADLYKVLEIDGEKVEGKWLLEEWSQWEGSFPSAQIMDIEELKKYLTEDEFETIEKFVS